MLGGLLPDWLILLTGTVIVLFAAFCFVAAVWRDVWAGPPPPMPDIPTLPRPLLLAINGFLVLVCLAALLGILFGRTTG